MDDRGVRKVVPEPGETEIDTVELQDWPCACLVDQQIDIVLHLGVPHFTIHQQVFTDPLQAIELSKLLKSFILTPIVIHMPVCRIDAVATCGWIKPAPLIERLIIGGHPIDMAE